MISRFHNILNREMDPYIFCLAHSWCDTDVEQRNDNEHSQRCEHNQQNEHNAHDERNDVNIRNAVMWPVHYEHNEMMWTTQWCGPEHFLKRIRDVKPM